MTAKEQIEQLVNSGRQKNWSNWELAEATGLSKNTVRRETKELLRAGSILLEEATIAGERYYERYYKPGAGSPVPMTEGGII